MYHTVGVWETAGGFINRMQNIGYGKTHAQPAVTHTKLPNPFPPTFQSDLSPFS